MKYAWIDKLKAVWPVTLMCQVLGVSVNGFFEHRQRSGKTPPEGPAPSRVSNEALVAHIRAIHAEFKGEYGWPGTSRPRRRTGCVAATSPTLPPTRACCTWPQ